MTDEQQSALNELRSGNMQLATVVQKLTLNIANKTVEMVDGAETVSDLLAAAKVIETVTKTVGLSPKESELNVQINAVNGFDFIEVDEEDIVQITGVETFAEAEVYNED